MSSLFPKIQELQLVTEFHFNYAESILNLLMKNILKEDSIEIEITIKMGDEGREYNSVITFADDESEDVILNLLHSFNEFIIEVTINTDFYGSSVFNYSITEDSPLLKIIPEKLREYMTEVWINRTPKTFQITGNLLSNL